MKSAVSRVGDGWAVWAAISFFSVGLGAGCSGKSRTTRGLETSAGEAGQVNLGAEAGKGGMQAGGGTSPIASGGQGGTPANGAEAGSAATSANGGSTTAGGMSGASAGTGVIVVGDGGTGAASASPECVAYRSKSIADACSELVTCAATLGEYLNALRAKGVSDWAAVRQGCGLVEITPRIAGEPDTILTFDAGGSLVGYWISEPARTAPCNDYKYLRGTLLDPDCAPNSVCPLEPNATSADELCACPCPDPPPSDGVAVVPARCVYLAGSPPIHCLDTADQQRLMMTSIEPPLPLWTRECGTDVADFLSMECVYDAAGLSEWDYNTGPLLGVRRRFSSCPGVTTLMTEGTPPPCTTP